jgi:hypothetical protein
MSNRTPLLAHVTQLLQCRLATWVEPLFRHQDEVARGRGWEVRAVGRGISRCYHDPRATRRTPPGTEPYLWSSEWDRWSR